MHPAALQTRTAASADRHARLACRDDLALLEHPTAAVQYGDADTGRIVDRAAAHGRAGTAAHLDPGGGARDDPHVEQFGVPSSTSSAGEAESWPSTCRSWTTAEARTVSGTPSTGAMRTEPGEPSGPRNVTARSTTRFSR